VCPLLLATLPSLPFFTALRIATLIASLFLVTYLCHRLLCLLRIEKDMVERGVRRLGCTMIPHFARVVAVLVDLAPHGAMAGIEGVLGLHQKPAF
jgi:hypothetical protein